MVEPIPAIEPHVPGRNGRDGLLLRVPYRAALVAELKSALPGPCRYWDEGVAAWWIDAREEAHTTEIVLHYFRAVAVLPGPGDEPTLLYREDAVPVGVRPP